VYEIRNYKGTDLLGGVKVKVDARAGYDQTLYNKEAAGEAINLGLVNVSDPVVKDKVFELMRLPKDLNEDQNVQIKRAEQAWSEFRRDGKVVVYDESIFDPQVWYATLGKRWMQDETAVVEQSVGFPQILERLTEWRQVLATEQAKDEQQRALYGAYPSNQWARLYADAQTLDQRVYEASVEVMTARGVHPGAPPQTAAPPEQGFLPTALAPKILEVWRRMMPALRQLQDVQKIADTLGMETEEVGDVRKLDGLLRMRAVIEAAKMLAEQRMMGASVGQAPPEQAAPGG